jgi:hypothetical protein
MKLVVTLPVKFWRDHTNRGCSQSAIEINRNKLFVTVQLDRESFLDIKSDAEFYATYKCEEGEEGIKEFQSSARATLKRLNDAHTKSVLNSIAISFEQSIKVVA